MIYSGSHIEKLSETNMNDKLMTSPDIKAL